MGELGHTFGGKLLVSISLRSGLLGAVALLSGFPEGMSKAERVGDALR